MLVTQTQIGLRWAVCACKTSARGEIEVAQTESPVVPLQGRLVWREIRSQMKHKSMPPASIRAEHSKGVLDTLITFGLVLCVYASATPSAHMGSSAVLGPFQSTFMFNQLEKDDSTAFSTSQTLGGVLFMPVCI